MKWFKKDKSKDTPTPKKAEKAPKPKAPANDDSKKSSWMPKVDLSEMFDKTVLASIDGAKKAGDLAKSATEASKNGLQKAQETTKGATGKLLETGKKLGQGTAEKAGSLTKGITNGAKAVSGKTGDVTSGIGKGAKAVGNAVSGAAKGSVEAHKRQTSGNLLFDFLAPVPVSKKEIGEMKKPQDKKVPAPKPQPKK